MCLDLPEGFFAEALGEGDLDEVVALVRRCEEHDSGAAMYERADPRLGADRIGQTVDHVPEDAIALLRRCGSVPVRSAWILRRDVVPTDAGAPVGPPDGSFTHWAIPRGADWPA